MDGLVHKSLKGSVLVAAPKLQDPNFERTVVLVAEHTEDGGFGLILNRPAPRKVATVWEKLTGETPSTDAAMFFGGPVEPEAVFLLHSCEDLAGGAGPLVSGVYLGNDEGLMAALLAREEELRERGGAQEIFRAYCGYAGWGEGQLDLELRTGSWFVQSANAGLIFRTAPEKLWTDGMERQGGFYRLFAQMPRDPELN